MTVIGYDSDIVTAESADDEEQDEEEDEYVFSLCWSVTVWITFEDNVCIFSVFVTGDDDDDDEEGDFCLVVGDSAQSAQLQFEDNISRKLEGLRTLHRATTSFAQRTPQWNSFAQKSTRTVPPFALPPGLHIRALKCG